MKKTKFLSTMMLGAVLVLPAGAAFSQSVQDSQRWLTQSTDGAFRIQQLEEQVRVLNGKVEDMTFQMLEMQELMRKMQEDNEFRFQELEESGDASGGKKKEENSLASQNQEGDSLGKPSPSELSENESSGGKTVRRSLSDVLENRKPLGETSQESDGQLKLGDPPAPLGKLRFDENGNLIDSSLKKPLELNDPAPRSDNANNYPNAPSERFHLGYQYVQAGDYENAESVFRSFVDDFPTDQRNSEASFWLGESLFSQGRYEEAARIFLENHKQNPDGGLAAQNLLKLGVSLAGLEQRELACATYAEVPKKYPAMSNAIRKRVEIEQLAAKCKNG